MMLENQAITSKAKDLILSFITLKLKGTITKITFWLMKHLALSDLLTGHCLQVVYQRNLHLLLELTTSH
jgi:hypothetical protein